MNTQINYQYRDGCNCKRTGSVIVQGTRAGGADAVHKEIYPLLESGSFVASQVGFPNLFLWLSIKAIPGLDHGYHEFMEVELTETEPTLPLSIHEVVAAFHKASTEGWREEEVTVPKPIKVVTPYTVRVPVSYTK